MCIFQAGKLFQIMYHHRSTYRYAKARISSESKMQNWYVVRRIKSVFPKLALLLRVWQRIFFTKFERRRKQRNSSFKKKNIKTQVIYIILKFKTHHEKWRGVRNVKPVMSPGVLAEIIILMPENKNTEILKAIIMLTSLLGTTSIQWLNSNTRNIQ